MVTLEGTAYKKSLPAVLTAIASDAKGTDIDHTRHLVRLFRFFVMFLYSRLKKQYPSAIYLRVTRTKRPHSIPLIHVCPRLRIAFSCAFYHRQRTRSR